MADADVEAQFSAVMAAVADMLKPQGFKKRGRAFRRTNHGNLELVTFQRSVSNDAHNLRFTLNIGIISNDLAKQDGTDASRLGVFDAHLHRRIGTFMPEPHDKWWMLNAEDRTGQTVEEITAILTERIVPYLDKHSSNAALIQLWKTGQSPGLTNILRLRYLSALEATVHDKLMPCRLPQTRK